MFGIGTTELVIIFVLVLLIFGPKRLPEIGRSLAKTLHIFKDATRDLRRNMGDVTSDLRREVHEIEKTKQEFQKSLLEDLSEGEVATSNETALKPPAEAPKDSPGPSDSPEPLNESEPGT